MTICAENRQHECQDRMGGCLGYDCGHYRGRGVMDEWDDDKTIDVKKEINNLIWMYAAGSLTLAEADHRACEILNIIRKNPGHAPEGGVGNVQGHRCL
jgi:hypothetical protein